MAKTKANLFNKLNIFVKLQVIISQRVLELSIDTIRKILCNAKLFRQSLGLNNVSAFKRRKNTVNAHAKPIPLNI